MSSAARLRLGLFLCAVAVASPGSGACAATTDARVDALIRDSRAAVGGSALDAHVTLRIDAAVTQGGLSGTGTQWLEIGGPRFAESYTTEPVEGGDGFDGSVVWNRDGSGLVWVDGGAAGRAQTIAAGYVSDDVLWSADAGGAAVAWGGAQSVKGTQYDSLIVTPAGSAAPFTLWFDRNTHLPARFVQTIGPLTITTSYAGYRRVGGLQIPFAVHSQTSEGNTTDVAVAHVERISSDASAQLNKPASNVRDFSIVSGATETRIPFDLVENHVYLDVKLNGKGPYHFVLDTGGSNLVDPAVALEVGAAGRGSVQGNGVGSATESISFAKIATLGVGDAALTDQLFAVAPVRSGFGVSAGRPVDGIIGFEVLSRFVTTFDYEHRAVVLSLPRATPPAAAASVVPFVFNGQQPQFACTIENVSSQCTLDTGARDSITLLSPFIAAHPQIVPRGLSDETVTGFGLGGPAMGKLGRLSAVGIGPFVVPRVVADFSTQTQGAFATPFVAANVGGNLLKRFEVVLDYGASTMTLRPNALFPAPDYYERGGLFLINHAGAKVVYSVRAGSPAAAAGIVKGDVITTVNGKNAGSQSLDDVRSVFMAAPGTIVRLGLTAKDGALKTATVKLADGV